MTTVALIRFKPNEDNVVCTLFEEENNKLKPYSHEIAPKYDMSKILPISTIFRIPEDKYKKFLEVLQSKEGHLIVNILKNRKTNEIINKYLTIEKQKIELSIQKQNIVKKHYNLLYFVEDMMAEDMGETKNALPRKIVGLTKQEIYEEFVQRGLI